VKKQYFITATDTNIGKTYCSAALLHLFGLLHAKVSYLKPIQCGASEEFIGGDAEEVFYLTSKKAECGLFLKHPCSPHLALKKNGLVWNSELLEPILAKHRAMKNNSDILIIEGAGGIRVPISDDYCMADLIVDLEKPDVIVCASPHLGTINQSLLTIEFMLKRDLPVKGFLFSPLQVTENQLDWEIALENARFIQDNTQIPFLGFMPNLNKGLDYSDWKSHPLFSWVKREWDEISSL
jgi:dethiobiotin synthetase